MTEFEQAYMLYEIIETANATLANYLTIVSAMLVTSYFAARKLDRTMSVIVLVIFSLISIGFLNELFSVYNDFARLSLLIKTSAASANSELGWISPVYEDRRIIPLVPYFNVAILFGAYVGAVWFFYHAKRQRKGGKQGSFARLNRRTPDEPECVDES